MTITISNRVIKSGIKCISTEKVEDVMYQFLENGKVSFSGKLE
jgi:hypothetical protein